MTINNLTYLLSTNKGALPHIIDTTSSIFHRPFCLYIDDFYYKDSYYYLDGPLPLKEFINTKNQIYLIFKQQFKKNRTLTSPRGNLKITEEEYKKIIEKLKPDFYQNYCDDKLNNGGSIYEIKDLSEIKDSNGLITTRFINELTESGYLLHLIENNNEFELVKEESKINSCGEECCKRYHKEYLNHLWNENEIEAKTIISYHNYYIIDLYFRKINK